MSVWSPATMERQPRICAGVGSSNIALNQAAVAVVKKSSPDTLAGYRARVTRLSRPTLIHCLKVSRTLCFLGLTMRPSTRHRGDPK